MQRGKKCRKLGIVRDQKRYAGSTRILNVKRNGKEKKEGGNIWLYSNIPYTNDFFTKTITLSSIEQTLQKHRLKCYCDDKKPTETNHSDCPSPVELRLPLLLIHSGKKKNQNRFLHTVVGHFKIDAFAHLKITNKPLFTIEFWLAWKTGQAP